MNAKTRDHYKLTKVKYLTDEEYDKLHRRLIDLYPHEPRNVTLILTAMYTGARARELLNIRPQDLDPENKTVFIRGMKGSDDRDVPVPDWLFTMLELLPKDEETIFQIKYPRLDQVWHSLRTCKKKFHALRHTFAIRHYRRTKDIRLIQLALGHRQVNNTLIYAAYIYKSDEMRRLLVG